MTSRKEWIKSPPVRLTSELNNWPSFRGERKASLSINNGEPRQISWRRYLFNLIGCFDLRATREKSLRDKWFLYVKGLDNL